MRKLSAMVLVVMLVTGFSAFGAYQQEAPAQGSISLISISSPYLGNYGETGNVYGVSGQVTLRSGEFTLKDLFGFRGTIAGSPSRVLVDNYWMKYEQFDILAEGTLMLDIPFLFQGMYLRPGLTFGSKIVTTKITQKWRWSNQVLYEKRMRGFWGPALELGLQKNHLSGYLGVKNIRHESCCGYEWSPMVYIGFGIHS